MIYTEKVKRLIEDGILVCPKTKERLRFVKEYNGLKLASFSTGMVYRLHNDSVPILLINDQINYAEYANASSKMSQEYRAESVSWCTSLGGRIYSAFSSDYRSVPARQAFESLFDNFGADATYLAVGGGPSRVHPALINLNIGPFPNVDIVADAHILPFVPESIDAIYCEAVLEHLYNPAQAVAEMFKALKPGSKVYVCTPFMQAYHGYPYHYQNFTLTGHQRLFEGQGFKIEDAGVAVGPTFALLTLNGMFFYEFLPKPFNWILGKTCGLLARFIRPFDIILNKRPNAHLLASTTYLLARKP